MLDFNLRNFKCSVNAMFQRGMVLRVWFLKLNKDAALEMTIGHLP